MTWEVALGIGEWLAWVYLICPAAITAHFRLVLWLRFLTAEMQRKIDERDGL
jgi:hypothetical protein